MRLGADIDQWLRENSSSSSSGAPLNRSYSFSGRGRMSNSPRKTISYPLEATEVELLEISANNDPTSSGPGENRPSNSHPNAHIFDAFQERLQINFWPPVCRICGRPEGEIDGQKLLQPCKCRGDRKYVHQQCIDREYYDLRQTACQKCAETYHRTPGWTPLRKVRYFYSKSLLTAKPVCIIFF